MTKMLDRSEAIAWGDAPPPPIAQLIGFDLISVKPGEAVVELQATEAHANPMGTLHGGVRSEEHTSELQSLAYLVCRLLLEKKKTHIKIQSSAPLDPMTRVKWNC